MSHLIIFIIVFVCLTYLLNYPNTMAVGEKFVVQKIKSPAGERT